MNKPIHVIASGYFSPVHRGHINYLRMARNLGDHLTVIVNNDLQVRLKTGREAFMDEMERATIVHALKYVDDVMVSVDTDRSVCQSLKLIRFCAHLFRGKTIKSPEDVRVIFANGGDVQNEDEVREAETCRKLGIEMAFGVGGNEKIQSSSSLLAKVRNASN